MDITFSQEDLAFREEVRAFLTEAYDDELKAMRADRKNHKQAMITWQRRLYEKGWIAPGWPKEHGGTGWTITQKFIFESERAAYGAPGVVPFGLLMVGPVIYTFGTEEQKQRFLPRILASEDWWCQGYSEPGAGSDLASLKTKAVLDGDDYIVNGAKIWTTYAQYADWIFCLVRTDSSCKQQDGISFLLIDMKTPGIKVNPIIGIDNQHTLNEVEFNNVRVPKANLIGEQNKGWTYAKALLAHERTSIAEVAASKRGIREIRELSKQELAGGKPLSEDPLFQKNLTDVEIELMALEYTELRALAKASEGAHPGPEASLLKIKGSQIQQAVQKLYLDVAGYYAGLQTELNIGNDYADRARTDYMYGRACTVYGGSNEVQKNIMAKAVLGLK